jgi:hypothetical protein
MLGGSRVEAQLVASRAVLSSIELVRLTKGTIFKEYIDKLEYLQHSPKSGR